MISGILVMLVITFGLSRIFLYALPTAIDQRARVFWANSGALIIVAAIYALISANETHGVDFALMVIGVAFAIPFQALWCWRDLSRLATAPVSTAPRSTSRPSFPSPQGIKDDAKSPHRDERWDALVRYDADVSAAADHLRPFGEEWINELGRAFFALNEEKKYLSAIVARLSNEAEAQRIANWATPFQKVFDRPLSAASLDILRQIERAGYLLKVEGRQIVATKPGRSESYFHDEEQLQRYSRFYIAPPNGA